MRFDSPEQFGHGLSYTSFAYSNLKVNAGAAEAGEGTHSITVTVDVANTGKVAGAEVAQLYLTFPASAGEPFKQMKGFQKVTIQPGAKSTVSFTLSDRDLSIWNVDPAARGWKVVSGDFGVSVGASSADIRQTGKFTI